MSVGRQQTACCSVFPLIFIILRHPGCCSCANIAWMCHISVSDGSCEAGWWWYLGGCAVILLCRPWHTVSSACHWNGRICSNWIKFWKNGSESEHPLSTPSPAPHPPPPQLTLPKFSFSTPNCLVFSSTGKQPNKNRRNVKCSGSCNHTLAHSQAYTTRHCLCWNTQWKISIQCFSL